MMDKTPTLNSFKEQLIKGIEGCDGFIACTKKGDHAKPTISPMNTGDAFDLACMLLAKIIKVGVINYDNDKLIEACLNDIKGFIRFNLGIVEKIDDADQQKIEVKYNG